MKTTIDTSQGISISCENGMTEVVIAIRDESGRAMSAALTPFQAQKLSMRLFDLVQDLNKGKVE